MINLGRYALTLYDKDEGKGHEGVRVFLDAQKVRSWVEINEWFLKLRSSKEQGRREPLRQIKEAGETILGLQRVCVQPQFAVKQHKGGIAVCPGCREACPADDGEACLSCQCNVPLYV